MENTENIREPVVVTQTQEDLDRLKNYYLDSQYGKYAVNYIEDMYPKYYEKMDLGNLNPEEKEYPVIFEAVVVGKNEYDTLLANIPYEHANRSGNLGIFRTTLMMYHERARHEMKLFINAELEEYYEEEE